ncbi:hypothetical protein M6B22_03105 [Jatrophihabitans cynanchi]|uniref:Uncharacterized protein n=1 Tax=Jatrophihabitans cynanchi TaxID=2944128 RepID=A0ABY7K2I8_9ACTN|nr:hypothetical protein [Jatrophihabitans sp. SB3-54]WAX57767.1 hypothetical protein M6B22_03105 [Jatrophihabitans sp. SB3-54]
MADAMAELVEGDAEIRGRLRKPARSVRSAGARRAAADIVRHTVVHQGPWVGT